MKDYRVVISDKAILEINESHDYIQNVLSDSVAANNFYDRFMAKIGRLSYAPGIGKLLKSDVRRQRELRLVADKSFMVIYVVDGLSGIVSIEKVVHKGFDYQSIVDKYL